MKYHVDTTKLYTKILNENNEQVAIIMGTTYLGLPDWQFRYGLTVGEKEAIQKVYWNHINRR
jgi:hypothetical protein